MLLLEHASINNHVDIDLHPFEIIFILSIINDKKNLLADQNDLLENTKYTYQIGDH